MTEGLLNTGFRPSRLREPLASTVSKVVKPQIRNFQFRARWAVVLGSTCHHPTGRKTTQQRMSHGQLTADQRPVRPTLPEATMITTATCDSQVLIFRQGEQPLVQAFRHPPVSLLSIVSVYVPVVRKEEPICGLAW